MITTIVGDLLDTKATYICHQVNCAGAMRSGVAKAIRDKWPVVYEEYMNNYNMASAKVSNPGEMHNYGKDPSEFLLGTCQAVPVNDNQFVINMFAQANYGYDGKRYTSYDAFYTCLERIAKVIPKGSTIAFPRKIGCCRGGADWDVIFVMIRQALGMDYTVLIYDLGLGKE